MSALDKITRIVAIAMCITAIGVMAQLSYKVATNTLQINSCTTATTTTK
jgi:hypothetical protein